MIDNENLKVKSEDNDFDDANFKEAFEICSSIFHNDLYSPNGKFNYITYNSIKRTVKKTLEIFGIEAFWFAENDIITNGIEYYGKQSFHPQILFTIFNSKKDEIEKYKKNLKKSDEIKSLELKKKDDEVLAKTPVYSLIPEVFDQKRAIPNVFLRSALFGVIKQGRRQFVKELKIQSQSQYEVFYTGERLDQNDLEVWDTLAYLAKNKCTEYELKISMYELCKMMEYSISKTTRDRIKLRINRLQLCQVKIKYGKGLYAGSLIDDYYIDDSDGKIVLRLNSRFLSIFSTNDYTKVNKNVKRMLGDNQLASWLFHFYETHADPIPYKIEYLRNLSGSNSEQKEFNRMLKTALLVVKNAYQNNKLIFNFDIRESMLHIVKRKIENDAAFN
jgi:hypothetical protein